MKQSAIICEIGANSAVKNRLNLNRHAMNRRSFFKILAGAAALPIVAKLPLPAQRAIERVGAWATIRVEAGAITSITITDGRSRYCTGDVISVSSDA
jgi:hypothetical protein